MKITIKNLEMAVRVQYFVCNLSQHTQLKELYTIFSSEICYTCNNYVLSITPILSQPLLNF